MTDEIIQTHPPSTETTFLTAQYYAAKAGQSDLMDQLARDLIKLQLAIPGIYAAALKLIEGSDATVSSSPLLFAVVGCWGVSLLLTVISLIPRRWKVDTSKIKASPDGAETEPFSLEGFFSKTAAYKRGFLLVSTMLFFVGIGMAAFLTVGS